jgi:aspartyl aminopeptidase
VAFTLGNKVKQGVDLYKIIGCHTDSPVLKLAPVAKLENKCGFQQMNIQCYGGGLWRTWFDRDLGLAGKIIYKTKENKLTSALWDSGYAVMSIPSLCIHLDREPAFNPNKETHLKPILATCVIDQLMGEGIHVNEDDVDMFKVKEKNYKTFLDKIANDLEIDCDQIIDYELSAYDM